MLVEVDEGREARGAAGDAQGGGHHEGDHFTPAFTGGPKFFSRVAPHMKHVWTLDESPARAGRRPGALAEYKALRDSRVGSRRFRNKRSSSAMTAKLRWRHHSVDAPRYLPVLPVVEYGSNRYPLVTQFQ